MEIPGVEGFRLAPALPGWCCLGSPCCCGSEAFSLWSAVRLPGPSGGDGASCLSLQTTLCNTSLDNPTQRNKDQLIRAAVKFLDTDTIW